MINQAHKDGTWQLTDYTIAGDLRTPCRNFHLATQGRSYHYLDGLSYLTSAITAVAALPGTIVRTLIAGASATSNIKTCVTIAATGTVKGVVSLFKAAIEDRSIYAAREQERKANPQGRSAFLGIDLQNDFLPGGSLEVPKGDRIISVFNKVIALFDEVIFSQDFHPDNHGSFAINLGVKEFSDSKLMGLPQKAWPKHCVQGTDGAKFAKELTLDKVTKYVQKGLDWLVDSYGAFCDNTADGKIDPAKMTELDEYLKSKNIKRLYVGGLATDFCVKFSVLQARELNYEVYVLTDAIRAIGIPLTEQKDGTDVPKMIDKCPVYDTPIKSRPMTTSDAAILEMRAKGAKFIKSDEIAAIEEGFKAKKSN